MSKITLELSILDVINLQTALRDSTSKLECLANTPGQKYTYYKERIDDNKNLIKKIQQASKSKKEELQYAS